MSGKPPQGQAIQASLAAACDFGVKGKDSAALECLRSLLDQQRDISSGRAVVPAECVQLCIRLLNAYGSKSNVIAGSVWQLVESSLLQGGEEEGPKFLGLVGGIAGQASILPVAATHLYQLSHATFSEGDGGSACLQSLCKALALLLVCPAATAQALSHYPFLVKCLVRTLHGHSSGSPDTCRAVLQALTALVRCAPRAGSEDSEGSSGGTLASLCHGLLPFGAEDAAHRSRRRGGQHHHRHSQLLCEALIAAFEGSL